MTQDPWAALSEQRRRRHWRQWPWGPIALGLAVLALSGVFFINMLINAAVRMPGDGSGRDLTPYVVALLVFELVTVSAGVVASVLGWRLNRGRVTALIAMLLLALWIGTLLGFML